MKSERRAVLDVGTNSIKLLVADVLEGSVVPVLEQSRQTRLGEGLYENHTLQADRITATVDAAAVFATQAKELGAQGLRVIATSATREASNRHELTEQLELVTSARVEVISGAREAELAFSGVCTDERYRTAPVLLLEVGGGSTQVLLGQAGQVHFRASLALGAVRLMQRFPQSDPPLARERERCAEAARELLASGLGARFEEALASERGRSLLELMLVGVGGTASVLGGMQAGLRVFDRERLEQVCLSLSSVAAHEETLWKRTLAERRQLAGVPPSRADIAPYGALVVHTFMSLCALQPFRVSTRGLRFGALLRDAPSRSGDTPICGATAD